MPPIRTRSMLVGIAAAVALVAGGTAAGAAIAGPVDGSGVIHGCWSDVAIRGSSHLFVLQDAGTTCPTGTTAISWNQQGPQGVQGPQGPAGPAGTSHAFTASTASVIGPSSPQELLGAPIVEVDNLPPGNFVAWVAGETDVTSLGEDFNQCFLETDGGAVLQSQNEELNGQERGTYALTGAVNLPNGGSIVLRCGTNFPGLGAIDYVNNSLTVIQVDTIN